MSLVRQCESCFHKLSIDAIFDPLLAPPVDRRHRVPADHHREMQMVTDRQTGRAAAPENGVGFHEVASYDVNRRKMSVERLKPHAVIEDHAIAIDPEPTRMNYTPTIRGLHGGRGRRCEIEP